MPLPPKRFAERRAHTVGDDQVGQSDPPALGVSFNYYRADSCPRHFDVDGLGPQQHCDARVFGVTTYRFIEFESRDGATVWAKPAVGPPDLLTGAPPIEFQAIDARPVVEVGAHPERAKLGDCARGEPIAAGFVTREDGHVDEKNVASRGCGVIRRGRATRAGADNHHVGGGWLGLLGGRTLWCHRSSMCPGSTSIFSD